MMKTVKALLFKSAAWLIVLCIVLPVVCAAADLPSAPGTADASRRINGYVPAAKTLRGAPAPSSPPRKTDRVFPEKYRSDEQVWAQGIKARVLINAAKPHTLMNAQRSIYAYGVCNS